MDNNGKIFGISPKSYALLIEALSNSEIDKAIIFGSRAMGNEKVGSDIDIAVLGDKLTVELLNKLKIQINEHCNIPYFVDIIDYKTISNLQLKEHIDEVGKIIFQS